MVSNIGHVLNGRCYIEMNYDLEAIVQYYKKMNIRCDVINFSELTESDLKSDAIYVAVSKASYFENGSNGIVSARVVKRNRDRFFRIIGYNIAIGNKEILCSPVDFKKSLLSDKCLIIRRS